MSLEDEFQRAGITEKERQDRKDFGGAIMQDARKTVAQIVAQYPGALGWYDGTGMTGLHVAACYGRLELIDFFLARGVNIDLRQQGGERHTPLMTAIDMGRPDAAAHLIDCGADMRARDGNSPLVMAAGKNMLALTLRIAVTPGVSVDEKDRTGTTALMAAAARGHSAIVLRLLLRGASLDATNNDGKDAATLAADNGHPQIAEDLRRERARRAQAVIDSMTAGAADAIQVYRSPLKFKTPGGASAG